MLPTEAPIPPASRGFEDWLTEGMRLSDAAAPDHQGALGGG